MTHHDAQRTICPRTIAGAPGTRYSLGEGDKMDHTILAAGTPVMIRDNMAGLIVGRLHADYAGGQGWSLGAGARKIHYWSKAAGPEGAALNGPGPDSRVCPPASLPRAGCALVEIVGLTEAELGALLALPVWAP